MNATIPYRDTRHLLPRHDAQFASMYMINVFQSDAHPEQQPVSVHKV